MTQEAASRPDPQRRLVARARSARPSAATAVSPREREHPGRGAAPGAGSAHLRAGGTTPWSDWTGDGRGERPAAARARSSSSCCAASTLAGPPCRPSSPSGCSAASRPRPRPCPTSSCVGAVEPLAASVPPPVDPARLPRRRAGAGRRRRCSPRTSSRRGVPEPRRPRLGAPLAPPLPPGRRPGARRPRPGRAGRARPAPRWPGRRRPRPRHRPRPDAGRRLDGPLLRRRRSRRWADWLRVCAERRDQLPPRAGPGPGRPHLGRPGRHADGCRSCWTRPPAPAGRRAAPGRGAGPARRGRRGRRRAGPPGLGRARPARGARPSPRRCCAGRCTRAWPPSPTASPARRWPSRSGTARGCTPAPPRLREDLSGAGYAVHGDLDALLPPPTDPDAPADQPAGAGAPTEAGTLAVAVRLLLDGGAPGASTASDQGADRDKEWT